jgi:hypothetical protein
MGNQGQEPPLLGLVTAADRRYCRLLTAVHRYSRGMTDTAPRYSGLVTVARQRRAFARASGLCSRRAR